MDLPPPAKKARALAATPRSKPARPSVPWIKGALHTPAPCDDTLADVDEEIEEESVIIEPNPYQQVCYSKLASRPLLLFLWRECFSARGRICGCERHELMRVCKESGTDSIMS